MQSWYLCSLGANLQPEYHFQQAKLQLQALGRCYYTEPYYTKPVGMHSKHDFLNALFIMQTDLTAAQLKQRFNAIETALGRDRNDPQSAQQDRPMDIDIIGALYPGAATAAANLPIWQQVPDYLQPSVASMQQTFDQLRTEA